MKAQIIGRIDIPVYVAVDDQGQYLVLSLDDANDLQLGDVLEWDPAGPGGLHLTVRNVTRGREVQVCLEDWGCTREHAFQRLRQFGASSQVWTLEDS